MTSRWCEPGLTHQISTTGCPAIHILTLNATIVCEFQLIIKSFHSMKFNTLQICLVYKTPCYLICMPTEIVNFLDEVLTYFLPVNVSLQ